MAIIQPAFLSAIHSPMVALNVGLNWLLQNLCMKLLFPTPESPTNTTLNSLCLGGGVISSSVCQQQHNLLDTNTKHLHLVLQHFSYSKWAFISCISKKFIIFNIHVSYEHYIQLIFQYQFCMCIYLHWKCFNVLSNTSTNSQNAFLYKIFFHCSEFPLHSTTSYTKLITYKFQNSFLSLL